MRSVCLSVTVAGWQQGVNLLAAVSVLITTDVCCKRIAAGNKDTMVSAAVPWCDSIRQEDAYWQGEKGGRTERERAREWGSNQSSSQSPWHWRNVMKVHTIIPPTAQEHYLNSNIYQGLNVNRRAPNNTSNRKWIDNIRNQSVLYSHLSSENAKRSPVPAPQMWRFMCFPVTIVFHHSFHRQKDKLINWQNNCVLTDNENNRYL